MMKTFIKKQPPGRLIAMGFAMVILIGTCLLLTPWSVRHGEAGGCIIFSYQCGMCDGACDH